MAILGAVFAALVVTGCTSPAADEYGADAGAGVMVDGVTTDGGPAYADIDGACGECTKDATKKTTDTEIQGQQPLRILFDAAHGQRAGHADWVIDLSHGVPLPAHPKTESDWSGAYSAFGVALDQEGYQLRSLNAGQTLRFGTSGSADLQRFDVLVVPEPNDPLSPQELNAIIAFVKSGGGVLLVADHGGADRNHNGWDAVKIFNQLFLRAKWGVKLRGDNRTSITQIAGDGRLGAGMTPPLKSVGTWNGSTIILNTNNNPTLRQEAAVKGHSGGVTTCSGMLGKGRFILHGDSSSLNDGTSPKGNNPKHDAWHQVGLDNAPFFLRAIGWLSGGPS